MKYPPIKTQSGFTLIETIVAIFILTMTIGALLTLAAGGFYSVRYARNQIVADNLTQESLEYIHHTRDTMIMNGVTWDEFVKSMDACFSKYGCTIDPYTDTLHVRECARECKNISFYPKDGFYGYDDVKYPSTLVSDTPYGTSFVRTITMRYAEQDTNQVIVNVKMQWLNGTTRRTVNQSTVITNWQH